MENTYPLLNVGGKARMGCYAAFPGTGPRGARCSGCAHQSPDGPRFVCGKYKALTGRKGSADRSRLARLPLLRRPTGVQRPAMNPRPRLPLGSARQFPHRMEVITMPTTHRHHNPPPPMARAHPLPLSGRFGRVPARWLEDPGIGVDELAVLTALAVHAGRDGVCVVRQRTLAGLLQRSREWVCRVLARLCEPGGFVEKEHRADRDGWNLACRYRLPDLAAPGGRSRRYPR